MAMAMHALHIAGVEALTKCLVVPLATGMSLSLCLLTVRAKLCTSPDARYVIWPRIDQKSCFKCIMTAGLIPLVVENVVNGDAIETDVEAVARLLVSDEYKGKVVAVLSTTSCFAPRRPDKIDALARLCEEHSVAHVINNAYGLQCPGISRLINRACAVGRGEYCCLNTC
jgi:O-phospho-L-seryl-tRNASec:L-selenocysteinyl-tRNA synthase